MNFYGILIKILAEQHWSGTVNMQIAVHITQIIM
jgi:hypothetical protein